MRVVKITLLAIAAVSVESYIPVGNAYTIEEEDIIPDLGFSFEEGYELEKNETGGEITIPVTNFEEQGNSSIATQNYDRRLAWYPGNPRAAWFMSYPESGISYFLHLIHITTGRSTATNYGHLLMRRDGSFYQARGTSTEIYENGPVYYAPYLIKKMDNVATRSHSTGYCLYCHPKKYYYVNFHWKSASGNKLLNNKRVTLQYNPSQVKKMIHLIRDPHDIVVARFFSYVNIMKKSKPSIGERYPLNPTGFKLWCKDMDDTFEKVDLAWLPAKLRGFAIDVPCRQEFVKYALWHTNAFKMSRFQNIERLVVTFDDYLDDIMGTVKKVNSFLGLKTLPNVELKKQNFKRSKWIYAAYYTMDERNLIERLLRNMVIPSIWPKIREYTPRYVLMDLGS